MSHGTDTTPLPPLKKLAKLYGILLNYKDVFGQWHDAGDETLLALLRSLGAELRDRSDIPAALEQRRRQVMLRGLEPVIVAWDGKARQVDLTLPVAEVCGRAVCSVELEYGTAKQNYRLDALPRSDETQLGSERFVTLAFTLPDHLPWGYNRLTLDTARRHFESLVISAPAEAYWPPCEEEFEGSGDDGSPRESENGVGRDWGCFLPLYALRSDRDWGAGDLTDMRHLVAWLARQGGTAVGTLPLLASYLDDPCDPSPYAPVSRLFWNALYVDPRVIPELTSCPRASEILESCDFDEEVRRLRNTELVDYQGLARLKRRVLAALADSFFAERSGRFADFTEFVRADPLLEDYARFRATHEMRREPWPAWPARMRDGDLRETDYDQRAMDYHRYVQWLATRQLQAVSDHAEECSCGLYLDLPVGVRDDGYDVWRHRDLFATGAKAGAPPDAVWTGGQNWGFSPFHPDAVRASGYRYFRQVLQRHFQIARFLRIDHVMGLHRLFWIPHGMAPHEGAYVQYKPDEWYAILCLESHRHTTGIVGENLGTVPPEVNRSLRNHQIRHLYVIEYELESEERPQETVDKRCVASLNTHDTPMFAAWWQSEDLMMRRELDLMDAQELEEQLQDRERLRHRLADWLRERGWLEAGVSSARQVLSAALAFMAASPAELLMVNLEDLWGESRPQNIPGTAFERPNWKRKAARTLNEFAQDEDATEILRLVNRTRRRAVRDSSRMAGD